MNKLELYQVIILSAHISGITRSTVSLSGVVTNMNNKKSRRINFPSNASTLCTALFLIGNLF